MKDSEVEDVEIKDGDEKESKVKDIEPTESY